MNKNAVFGDSSALAPGGVRIGKNCYNIIDFSSGVKNFYILDRNENSFFTYLP